MPNKLFFALLIFSAYTSNIQASNNDANAESPFFIAAAKYINAPVECFEPVVLQNDKFGIISDKLLSLKNLKNKLFIKYDPKNMQTLLLFLSNHRDFKQKRIQYLGSEESESYLKKETLKNDTLEKSDLPKSDWNIYMEEITKEKGYLTSKEEKRLPQYFICDNKVNFINTIKQTLTKHLSLVLQDHILFQKLNKQIPNLNSIESRLENRKKFNESLRFPLEIYKELDLLSESELQHYLNHFKKTKKEYKFQINTKLLNIESIFRQYTAEVYATDTSLLSRNYVRLFDPLHEKEDLKFDMLKQLYLARYYYILTKISIVGPGENYKYYIKGLTSAQEERKLPSLEKEIVELKKNLENKDEVISLFKNKLQGLTLENKEYNLKLKRLETALENQRKESEKNKQNFINRNNILNSNVQLEQENNKKLKNKLKKERKKLTEAKNNVSQLHQEVDNLKKVLKNEKNMMDQAVQKENKLTKIIEEKEIAIINLQKEKETLTEQYSELMKKFESVNEEMRNLIEASKTNIEDDLRNSHFTSTLSTALCESENDNSELFEMNQLLNQQLQEIYQRNIHLENLNSDLINENGSLHSRLKEKKKENMLNISYFHPSGHYGLNLTNTKEEVEEYIKKLENDVKKLSLPSKNKSNNSFHFSALSK